QNASRANPASPETAALAADAARLAALTQEIARLREAEADTLDHGDLLYLTAERERKERELADLPTPSAPEVVVVNHERCEDTDGADHCDDDPGETPNAA